MSKFYSPKINRFPEIYMIFAWKNNKIVEFYTNFGRKMFFPNFWRGGKCPRFPVSYAYYSKFQQCQIEKKFSPAFDTSLPG